MMELLDAVGLAGQTPAPNLRWTTPTRHHHAGPDEQPVLLLVDEPTSALDTERGQALLDLLRRLPTERNLITVMVTPNHDHLADVAESPKSSTGNHPTRALAGVCWRSGLEMTETASLQCCSLTATTV